MTRQRKPAVDRYCTYCGRYGTRQFVLLGGRGWICARKLSCDRRRRAWNRGFAA